MSRPPRVPELILVLTLRDAHVRDDVLGDLEAQYHHDLGSADRFPGSAGLRYWLNALAVAMRFVLPGRSGGYKTSSASPDPSPVESTMANVIQDFRFALRSLRRSPGFATIAVLTLAAGIGANTAIFSLINSVLLTDPEHVTEADELVTLWTSDFSGPQFGASSYLDFLDYRDRTPALSDAALVSPGAVNMTGEDGISQILVSEFVSGNYLDLLGVRPRLGRWFTEEEGEWGSGSTVGVIGHGLWTRAFGSDPSVIGTTVRLSGHTITVVGVAPDGFKGSLPVVSPDFWLPLATYALIQGERAFQSRGNRGWLIRGRLAEGATIETAQAQLDVVAAQLLEEFPQAWTDVRDQGRRATVVKDAQIPPQLQGAVTGFASLLMAVVGVVLLIACANIANLTLARASRRHRELAIQLSLGAGRGRVMRQMLMESGVVGVLGGVAGAALAFGVVRFAESYRPATGIALTLDLGLDSSVLLFSALMTGLTVLAVGLLPALRSSRPDLVTSLKEGGETEAGRFRWFQLRNLLVITQVSASLVLLVGAGLFLKSLQAAMNVDAGFTPEGISTVALNLSREGYSIEEAHVFFGQLQDRVRALPGVESTALSDALPLTAFAGRRTSASIPGYQPGEGEDMEFQFFSVGPGYFATMENPLRSGREFTDEDHADASLTVVVNETFAERFWPGEDPLGKLVNWNDSVDAQVVGLAEDAVYRQLNEEPRPAFFIPLAQNPSAGQTLIVRTAPDRTGEMLGILRTETAALNSRLPLSSLRTMEEAVAGTLLPQRIASWLLSIAGGLGLLLASVGLYGIMSYLVAQRTREVGIRMALGAQAKDVVRMVVRRGLVLAALGSAFGLALAFGVTRFLQSLLFGVSTMDLSVFGSMTVVAIVVAGVASYVPARRAAMVDPAVTLREE